MSMPPGMPPSMMEPMSLPEPPALGIERTSRSWPLLRIAIVGVAQALALFAMTWLLDNVKVSGWLPALAAVAFLALLNAVLWPIAVRLTLPLITWTVGLFTFVLNGLFVNLTAWVIDGFEVGSFWSGLVVAFALTIVNLTVGGLVNIDDEHVWRQHVVKRLVRRHEQPDHTDEPGFLFIQIDGLGHDVLRDAMASGHAPMLAGLVEGGTHRLVGWECDLSSQTGAMQAGILLGDNSNMPAFRWYEKDTGRIMVSNRPKDAAEIEHRQSSGHGLLANGGASRANVFSGDAPDTMLTFSTVLESRSSDTRIGYAMATPYTLMRIIALSIADIARELRAAHRAKKDGVEPQMHRGGVYPLLRAATTVVLSEMTIAMLIADIERGVPATYADFVGYDEVAHHSGIAAPEALDTLRRTDEHLRRLLTMIADAPRPYYVVILSDHGQTQGSTFEQRYGQSLEDLVHELAREAAITAPVLAGESWNNVNGMLSDAAAEQSRLGRTVARVTRKKTDHGEVALGPATETQAKADDGDVVVLASGNLGLLSITHIEGRATRQQLEAIHPGLIEGLAAHDGVGWVLVRDDELGDLAIGAEGVHHLRDGTVEGSDPLASFGRNAADHLRRTSSFGNCPDLLVNSFYDPAADEGAAFEELIGFHGGMGGAQCHPFVMAPANLPVAEPLVGALSIHDLFKSWVAPVEDAIA
jgi:uncharacterized membrane protein YvlD (DUF360 family)